MKWTKRNEWGTGCLGQGYESGEFLIEETYNDYELQQKHGGRRCDYYWVLLKNNKPIKYAKTAKALKIFAENI